MVIVRDWGSESWDLLFNPYSFSAAKCRVQWMDDGGNDSPTMRRYLMAPTCILKNTIDGNFSLLPRVNVTKESYSAVQADTIGFLLAFTFYSLILSIFVLGVPFSPTWSCDSGDTNTLSALIDRS